MSVVSSLGFIGAGQVAKVIANGFLSARIIKANQIIVSATSNTDLDHFRNIGCNATDNNKLVMKESKFVFLEIRANVFPGVLKEISSIVTRNHLLASLASGVTLSFLENSLPDKTRIVRVMLNSAVQYREGIIAVTRGRFARAKDITLVHEMMSPVGYCVDVNENSMAMVTALMTAGFMYVVIDALADGAVRAGLNRPEAVKLVAQTAAGAAKMVLHSGKHIGELKDSLCVGGGSTIAGINALEERGLRGALMRAVHDATERANELRSNGTW